MSPVAAGAQTPLLAKLAAELGVDMAELEALLTDGGSEAIVPTYLTLNANGTVTAAFTGQVKASGGIVLNEFVGAQAFAAPSAVGWYDSGGTLRSFVQGYTNPPGDVFHELLLEASDSVTPAVLRLRADGAGSANALLQMGSQLASILAADGTSSFTKNSDGIVSRRVSSLYSFAFNVPNAGDADVDVITDAGDVLIAGGYTVEGSVDSTAGFQYPQALSWATQRIAANTLRFHLSNRLGTGLASIGTMRFRIVFDS